MAGLVLVLDQGTKEQLLKDVQRKQAVIRGVDNRMKKFHVMFREERDVIIHRLLDEAKTPGERIAIKRELCTILGVTPQWLNRLLRGEAYRRSTD